MKGVLSAALMCALCAMPLSAKRAPAVPEWLSDTEKAFPAQKYLAQVGSGRKADEAEADAAERLSRYISVQVESSLVTELSLIDDGSGVIERESAERRTRLESRARLFSLRTTEPYYARSEKKYYCAAYISRDEAFEQYRTTADQKRQEFYGFYDRAKAEPAPLLRLKFYESAYKKGAEFLESLEIIRAVNRRREAEYAADRKAIAEIPALMQNTRLAASVRVEVTGDYGGIVSGALVRALGGMGIPVSESGWYTARAEVSPNMSGSDADGWTLFPAAELSVSGKDGKQVSALSVRSGRTFAWTKAKAQNSAYGRLAEEIETRLPQEFPGQ